MPSSFTLGTYFEGFVRGQVTSGRYNNASEVVRDALRLMEERERQRRSLDEALMRGIADADAGRVIDLDEACAALVERYSRMTEPTAAQ